MGVHGSSTLALCPPQTKLGAGRLMGPKGVAVDRNGHIIVVDNKACCVFIFQPNGKLVARFGSRGTAERQFAGTPGTPPSCETLGSPGIEARRTVPHIAGGPGGTGTPKNGLRLGDRSRLQSLSGFLDPVLGCGFRFWAQDLF